MDSPKDRFASAFFTFDFFQAVRLLERMHPDRSPVGLDAKPADEVARFRAHASLAFPPSQIVALDPPEPGRPNPLLTVTFFGLYGPSGVLPQHYTQMILDLIRDERGPERRSLRDWLDLFDHRLISLFYRAWEKYRFYIPFERALRRKATGTAAAAPDTFTLAVRSLMGLGTARTAGRLAVRPAAAAAEVTDWGGAADVPPLAGVDDLALLHYAGFFAQRPRNATNLRLLLADYFRLPVEVVPFRGQWLRIPADGQTRLGAFGTLGRDAVAGDRVWDVRARFLVRVGPLALRQFDDLLPDPEPVPRRKTFFLMAQLARLYAGAEYDVDVQLVLAGAEVPEVILGDGPGPGPRLGWSMWLISAPPRAPVGDAVFDADWVTAL
jgi:type VI secretion system protein ImpH